MAGNEVGENSQRGSSMTASCSYALLIVCRCFRVITALATILCIVVNVLSAIQSFKDEPNIFNGIFRCYAILVALIVVVTETELHFILKFSKVLEYWVGRGLLQIFVAVMTKAYVDTSSEQTGIVLLQNIASYMLLACGVIYVISGILGIGCFQRSRQHKELTKERAVADLAAGNQQIGTYMCPVLPQFARSLANDNLELERRRDELKALLVEDNV